MGVHLAFLIHKLVRQAGTSNTGLTHGAINIPPLQGYALNRPKKVVNN